MKLDITNFFIGIFCISMSSFSSSCIKEVNTTNIPVTPLFIDTTPKRILALGDSYTIGHSLTEADRFASQARLLMIQQNLKIAPVEYIATTGWTTLNLQSAITSQNPQGPYDIVTLLIGVNDQYQNRDTVNYRSRFTTLLLRAIALADNRKERVFVLSIPDYSITPFVPLSFKAEVSKEIDWFNAINKSVTLNYDINYTDITPSTREAVSNPSLISSDGLHPSALEYKKWADFLVPKIYAVLK